MDNNSTLRKNWSKKLKICVLFKRSINYTWISIFWTKNWRELGLRGANGKRGHPQKRVIHWAWEKLELGGSGLALQLTPTPVGKMSLSVCLFVCSLFVCFVEGNPSLLRVNGQWMGGKWEKRTSPEKAGARGVTRPLPRWWIWVTRAFIVSSLLEGSTTAPTCLSVCQFVNFFQFLSLSVYSQCTFEGQQANTSLLRVNEGLFSEWGAVQWMPWECTVQYAVNALRDWMHHFFR